MVPTSVLVGLLIFSVLGTTVLFWRLGVKEGAKWSARLLLVEYLFLLISLTLLFRAVLPERRYILTPFRFWGAIQQRQYYSLTEVIMNVAAFIPVGLLLGGGFGRMKWWKVLLFGGAFSVLVEVLQYISRRGFAEVDDVVYNVVGCMIGYGIAYSVKKISKDRKEKAVTFNPN